MAGRGNLHIALVDWQTDLYNCTLILSQTVGFTIFPRSHVQDPTRDLAKSTPLSVTKTLVALPCYCALHFQALLILLILKIIAVQAYIKNKKHTED